MVGVLCGGVCDLKRTTTDLHYCLKWERDELAWALVVCECIVVDEQMGKRHGRLEGVEEKRKKHIPLSRTSSRVFGLTL